MVSRVKRSELFAETSEEDRFFRDDELTHAARAAAPLRVAANGSTVSFIHKTLQEHFTATAIIRDLRDAVLATLMDGHENPH